MEGDIETPVRRPSARKRRAMSAIARPGSGRPKTASRRPYSAYTKREGEAENVQKYDGPESNREWWRFYMKVPLHGSCYDLSGLGWLLLRALCAI